ncbi:sensor histidine kinase [Actinomadura sp. 9N407]|uniref:sensor histidine kinase n=1 Tax=Actinomadura sp. 9N407 TaxID=3375154 RepID=UPI0037AA5E71
MTTVVILAVLAGLALPPAGTALEPAVLAAFAIQAVHCLPRTRAFRDRWGGWTLALQAALTPFGGPAGFLAASVLLIVPRRWRWAAFAGVAGGAGLLNTADLYTCANAMGNAVCQGLFVFALTRLSDLRAELQASRGELAARSVAGERARVSGALEDALGGTLSEIIRLAGEGAPGAILERAAAARARVRRAPEPPETAPPGDLTPRLAVPIVIVVHLWYPVIAMIYVASVGPPLPLAVAYAAGTVLVVALQLYHVLPRPPGVPPRQARWTLPLQTFAAALPLLAPDRPYPQLMWFAAGSILIVLAGRRVAWAWAGAGAYTLLVPAALLARGGGLADAATWTVETAGGALMFYGLALFTHLVYQVREVRESLALLAVAEERRRIARDVHDLLGAGLWGIMVKAQVAAGSPERAPAELADVAQIARRTLGDLRAIPGDRVPDLSPATELDSARELLTAAGVEVSVEWPAGLAELPRPVDALLGTVLREAVTNVLRHAAARTCRIEASREGHLVRLRVANDGVRPGDGEPPGQGIANLTARVAALGGELTAGPTAGHPGDQGGRYELTVLQPAGLGGDPDRVETVAGAELGEDRA